MWFHPFFVFLDQKIQNLWNDSDFSNFQNLFSPFLLLVATQIILFFGIGPPFLVSETVQDVLISPNSVIYERQYSRLFFGQMEHASDFHLYYNVMSLIWKGYYIERTVGFRRYSAMMIVFILACGLGTVYTNYFIYLVTSKQNYYSDGVIGFSSVIFAMKIVLSSYDPTAEINVGGLGRMAMNIGAWFELVLCSLFNPYASFIGHLVGILVGYEYTKGFILKPLVASIEAVIGIGLEMSGLDEIVERKADEWNAQDDGNVNQNAGMGMRGMFGMGGMGGMGYGMGGMGYGMGGMRRRRYL